MVVDEFIRRKNLSVGGWVGRYVCVGGGVSVCLWGGGVTVCVCVSMDRRCVCVCVCLCVLTKSHIELELFLPSKSAKYSSESTGVRDKTSVLYYSSEVRRTFSSAGA